MSQHYAIRALDESTWAAFAALVEANNGIFGGCWCTGMHPKDEDSTVPHRQSKWQRVRAATAHAALVFDREECVGWSQFGPPSEITRIKNRAAYERDRDHDLPDWRIGCFFTGKGIAARASRQPGWPGRSR